MVAGSPGVVAYMTMNPVATVVIATLLSALLVGAVRRYALHNAILDRPNHRSSHAIATPRGGGAGIVATILLMFAVATLGQSAMDWRLLLALLGIFPTAIAGWLDDQRGLTVAARLGAHLVSGLLLLPLAVAPGYGTAVALVLATGWIAATLCAINVVNFIDGVDGLIGLQGVVLGLHLATLGGLSAPGALLGAAMAGACAGFLLWNWAPARIFLGDVGSGSLGVVGVIGGILVWQAGQWPFLAIFLPLVPIFLDASVTMWRRARARERLSRAHRAHLYQRLANGGWGHARVAVLYGAAAGLGVAAAHAANTPAWPAIPATYVVLLLGGGILLDRQVPLKTAG